MADRLRRARQIGAIKGDFINAKFAATPEYQYAQALHEFFVDR